MGLENKMGVLTLLARNTRHGCTQTQVSLRASPIQHFPDGTLHIVFSHK